MAPTIETTFVPLHPSPPILTQFWSGIFWKRKSCFINVIPTVQSFPYYAGTFLQIIGVSSDPVLKKMRSLPDSLQYFFTAQFLYNMFFLSISIFRGTKKKGGRKKGHVSWSMKTWYVLLEIPIKICEISNFSVLYPYFIRTPTFPYFAI